ncbi:MAG: class I SAM-dependent methyltransferase [Solirubrobacterales bacterium]|nr:class I SAM-dependent methyltransferase [Solirubrobacterales bacterium]MBV9534844.1 class I SAM-dependent methyltransferase [Solirubrobacterales bacterium]
MSETAHFTPAASRRDELVDQLFASAVGALDLLCVYVGDRLGLYRALTARPSMNSAELAAATGIHERYAREWLEQQTVSRILETENPHATDGRRRYCLPQGSAEVLVDESSPDFMAALAQAVVGCTPALQAVLDAFRTGDGVSYGTYGRDASESQARGTRPLYEKLLTTQWLPSVPALHARLQADPPARVADVACGWGHSSLAIARGYPKVLVDGVDLDEPSIVAAREMLAGSGLEDRVVFHHRDAADAELSGRYDLVMVFEAIHDMPYPVDVLRTLRGMLANDGLVFVADERTAERFSQDAEETERLQYGFSVLHCLPVGMLGDGAAGTGTVMRPDTLRRYATAAGFAACEILPIEDRFWRFYLLTP